MPTTPSPAFWNLEGRVQKQVQAELDRRNGFHFHSYVTDHLGAVSSGQTYQVNEFHFSLDFPLALRVERDVPNAEAHQQRLLLSCLPPLSLQDLHILPGQAHNAKSVALPIEVEVNAETAGQWSIGTIAVPYEHQHLRIQSPALQKTLPYEVDVPTQEAQVMQALRRLYHVNAPEEGQQRWKKQLLEGSGAEFEVAMLNTIARVGIPVVFGGELAYERDGKVHRGGPSAEGYDVIALNYRSKGMALISVKGSESTIRPGYLPNDLDAAKLVKAVNLFQQTLPPGWTVTGIIVCQAPEANLGKWQHRQDVTVWGRESLEVLLQADSREQMERSLGLVPTPLYDLAMFGQSDFC